MTDEKSRNHLKLILASQYFLYFGVLGIFLPYFNLYCYRIGFDGFQIGVLTAVRTGATIIFPILWATIADRFHNRKLIYIFFNFISTAIWALYLYTVDFWAMLVITILYGIFYSPLISFLEAFTMDILGRERKSYGRIRAWGTFNFIVIVIVIGKIIDIFSTEIIIPLILGGSLIQSFISIKIPNIRISKKMPVIPWTTTLKKKQIVIFLFCAFLMLVSHGTYYGFFSIHLENMGYGNTFIGITWALASIAEILVMIKSNSIFRRFSLENVLTFSFMIATIRWTLLFFADTPTLILFSQLLHAVTYGTFHMASIIYIDQLAPQEAKTSGQAINNAVTYGLGMMVGALFNGYFFESIGSSYLFLLSGFIALSGGIIFRRYQKNICSNN
ncbi:MAG: MFS transporter [Desulfobacterales bacterium]|jgi:MFS transporter, PPP family, 3-phenylpropionic acid transporter|nr:MFS transporter [Desulfobacteraceae bacterium]MBT4362921.1 MFS transporter [Desulfobacteraceae bacterium]MBT7087006.1 MFS transporter [Desulfobacterales bacterium]MBT7695818.1 MFS transporter [Desulfobacterales bacterium]